MNIEIKKSSKYINYADALDFLEDRLIKIHEKKGREILWLLEHNEIYTAGTSYKKNEILDINIKVTKTNRGSITTEGGKKIWSVSEIAKLRPQQFAKYEKEIDLARREGRIQT